MFINAMVLISFISIATQIFREENFSKDSSIKVKTVTSAKKTGRNKVVLFS